MGFAYVEAVETIRRGIGRPSGYDGMTEDMARLQITNIRGAASDLIHAKAAAGISFRKTLANLQKDDLPQTPAILNQNP